MLLPSNAPALLLNSATSIWSSVTDGGFTSFAIFDSVSTAADLVLLAGLRGRRGRRARRGGGRRGRRRGGRARAARGRDRLDRRLGLDARRVEQERVAPHDASRRPAHLDDEVEERLGDRRGRGDAQERAARPLLDGDARARQRGLELHVVLAVERRVGDARGERVELVARDGRELDASRERLAERGLHGQAAEPQGVRPARRGQGGREQRQSEHRICAHAVPSPNA
jgi:hypothetical protein